MSAIRYSGNVILRVTYCDPVRSVDGRHLRSRGNPNGTYRVHATTIENEGTPHARVVRARVYVGAPAYLTHAVDSPEAFDDAARAALAFMSAPDEPSGTHASADGPTIAERAATTGAGYHVGRRAGQRWPDAPREAVENDHSRRF